MVWPDLTAILCSSEGVSFFVVFQPLVLISFSYKKHTLDPSPPHFTQWDHVKVMNLEKPRPKRHCTIFQSALSEDSSHVLSVSEACADISLSVSTPYGSYRKPAPVSAHCEDICCSVRQEAGKQEMCQTPCSHPNTNGSLLLLKVPWIFPKKHAKKIQENVPLAFPLLSVWINNKWDEMKIVPSPLLGDASVSQWSRLSQRFSVFWP